LTKFLFLRKIWWGRIALDLRLKLTFKVLRGYFDSPTLGSNPIETHRSLGPSTLGFSNCFRVDGADMADYKRPIIKS
jgi:hypothetical protein